MAPIKAESSYLAAGANRHPAAADWDVLSGLLAFGADRNVAIWRPQVSFGSRDLGRRPLTVIGR